MKLPLSGLIWVHQSGNAQALPMLGEGTAINDTYTVDGEPYTSNLPIHG